MEVSKVFHQGRPNETVALHNISIALQGGLVTVFMGPSGSGKTTLLSLIGCMARPTSGRIWLGKKEITSLPEHFLTELRRTTFGFIFQQVFLIPGLTVLENVMLPAQPLGLKWSEMRRKASQLLNRYNMEGKAGQKVEWLSGGEAQRVAIARALINDPPMIIADEPTAHLDSGLSREFMNNIAALKKEGKTVLIASHDPIVCDSPFVDRLVQIRDGRILETGEHITEAETRLGKTP